jgi:hypothetical protein
MEEGEKFVGEEKRNEKLKVVVVFYTTTLPTYANTSLN